MQNQRNHKKTLSCYIFLFSLSLLLLSYVPSYAAETDSEWYKDYTYELLEDTEINGATGNYIELEKYTGSQTDLTVPPKATIEGVEYTTYICGGRGESIWKRGITKLAFEDGVVLGSDLSDLFYYCDYLTELDISHFDTSNVTNMNNMFSHCMDIETLDLRNFDTSNVTDMGNMFNYCISLKELDVSSFITSKVTDMSGMFGGCNKLQELDVSTFNTSKVTNMSGMFAMSWEDTVLTRLNFDGLDTSSVTNMSNMFEGCGKLDSLDISWFDTSHVTDMSGMFRDCMGLTTLNLGDIDTSHVTDISFMFGYCYNLKNIDVSRFNTSSVTKMDHMFAESYKLTYLDVDEFDTSNVTNMAGMFSYCENLNNLDVSHFDTSNVEYMSSMFCGDESLENLDVSHFDTSGVKEFGSLFQGCSKLKTLDVSGFDTSNATSISSMFAYCESLKTLDVSGFDTSHITSTENMFKDCSSLKSLDVSRFDTSSVKYMEYMFSGCSSLTSLDVSHFNTTNVSMMGGMFSNCSSLKELDLSNFHIAEPVSSVLDGVDPKRYYDTTMKAGFLVGCDALAVLHTPKSVTEDITLPAVYYDKSFNFYTTLPKSQTTSLSLTRGPLDASAAKVTAANQAYTGSERKPAVNVTFSGKNISSDNYTVTYGNNINPGTATATVTFKGDYYKGKAVGQFAITGEASTAKQNQTVPVLTQKDIKIDLDSKDIGLKQKMKVKINLPAGVKPEKIVWKSSNKKIITVKPGKNPLTAVLQSQKGSNKKVKITVTIYLPGKKKISKAFYALSRKGRVKNVKIKGKSTIKKKVGKSVKLKATVRATKGANKKLKWTSSNPSCASVNKTTGKVVCKKKGDVTITARATDGTKKKGSIKIKIR